MTVDPDSVYLHSLIRDAVRSALSPVRLRLWTRLASSSLLLLLIDAWHDDASLDTARLLHPHVLAVADQAERCMPHPINAPGSNLFIANFPTWNSWLNSGRSLLIIADILNDAGDYAAAKDAIDRSLSLLTRSYPYARGFQPDASGPWVVALCQWYWCAAGLAVDRGDIAGGRSLLVQGQELARVRRFVTGDCRMLLGWPTPRPTWGTGPRR